MHTSFWQWKTVAIAGVACGISFSLFAGRVVQAATTSTDLFGSSAALADTDGDGIPDLWETEVYHTNPNSADTDGDRVNDRIELVNGLNPLGEGRLKDSDFEQDGLSDRLELRFGSDPMNPDTDGDTHTDGVEVFGGFSPTSTSPTPLRKSLRIVLKTQRLEQVVDGIPIASYAVSSGLPKTPTPPGTYKILNKNPKAWSSSAKLWMPYWMAFSPKGYGVHELPYWPSGYREGSNHLGHPASHGCVRLGIGPAKTIYDWTPVGTSVEIVRDVTTQLAVR